MRFKILVRRSGARPRSAARVPRGPKVHLGYPCGLFVGGCRVTHTPPSSACVRAATLSIASPRD